MRREKIVTIFGLILIFIVLVGILPMKIYTSKFQENSYSEEVNVKWSELYPFELDVSNNKNSKNSFWNKICKKIDSVYVENDDNIFKAYKSLIVKTENKIQGIINDNTILRTKIIELNGVILKLSGIKYITGSDTVIDLENEYLTLVQDKRNITYSANNFIEFSDWLKEKNIDLLYIQAPFKINKYDSKDNLKGYIDYSNENADNFISKIKEKNINILDLREDIKNEYTNNEYLSLFFKTDHHWLPKTGIWATEKIAERLNQCYDFNIDTEIYDIDNYNIEKYEDWLLGSLGKKVTLGFTNAEDLDIYYPKFETNLHVNVPSINKNIEGNFYDTLIYKRVLQKINYYNWDAYHAYGYGDKALVEVDNINVKDGKKILLIKDSFADCVFPYLSLGVNELSVIDLRHYTGSVKKYIEENNPDIILVLYNPSSLKNGEIELTSHTSTFDFK